MRTQFQGPPTLSGSPFGPLHNGVTHPHPNNQPAGHGGLSDERTVLSHPADDWMKLRRAVSKVSIPGAPNSRWKISYSPPSVVSLCAHALS